MKHAIKQELLKSRDVFAAMAEDTALHTEMERITTHCIERLQAGSKILLAGNGGSAADSQHLAAELVSRFNVDRPGLPAIAITTDTSALTAIGNDYGYEQVFSRQIEAIGNTGDVFWAFSTSGRSANILRALQAARANGLSTVGLSGKTGGDMPSLCDYMIHVPSEHTPNIQEGHIAIGHIICGAIEEALFSPSQTKKG